MKVNLTPVLTLRGVKQDTYIVYRAFELGFVDKNVRVLDEESIVMELVSATGREGLMLEIAYETGQ